MFRFVIREASSAASAGGNVFPLRYVVHIFFFLLRTLFQARILVTSACLPALMPNAERPGVASQDTRPDRMRASAVATMATPTDPVGIISRSLAAMVMGLDNQWRVHACCSAKGRGVRLPDPMLASEADDGQRKFSASLQSQIERVFLWVG